MIIEYIIDILKNDDDIYINGLGLFKKKRTTSEIKEKIIYPPQVKIFFEANGDGNGFAFILKYAEKEQKKINDADTEIRKWVEELKNSLANNKSITFENFGTFSLNPKSEIIFDSGLIRELNIDFEGMDPIRMDEKKTEINVPADTETITEVEKIEEVEEVVIVEEENEEVIEDEIEEVTEEGLEEEVEEEVISNMESRKKRSKVIVIPIIIIILGVAGYFTYPYILSLLKNDTEKAPVLSVTEIDETIPEIEKDEINMIDQEIDLSDSTHVEIDTQPQSDIKPLPRERETINNVVENSYPYVHFVKGNYYVIAGSFSTENSAIQHIANHKLQEYNPVLLSQDGNRRLRVCIGTFSSEEEAQQFADQFNRKYWVLK